MHFLYNSKSYQNAQHTSIQFFTWIDIKRTIKHRYSVELCIKSFFYESNTFWLLAILHWWHHLHSLKRTIFYYDETSLTATGENNDEYCNFVRFIHWFSLCTMFKVWRRFIHFFMLLFCFQSYSLKQQHQKEQFRFMNLI